MGLEFKDRTGDILSSREISQALEAVNKSIVKDIISLPPELGVQMTTIQQALRELLVLREQQESNS